MSCAQIAEGHQKFTHARMRIFAIWVDPGQSCGSCRRELDAQMCPTQVRIRAIEESVLALATRAGIPAGHARSQDSQLLGSIAG